MPANSHSQQANDQGIKKPVPQEDGQQPHATGLARGDYRYNEIHLRHLVEFSSSLLLDVVPVHRNTLPVVSGALLHLPSVIHVPVADRPLRLSVDGGAQLSSSRLVSVRDLHQSPASAATSDRKLLAFVDGEPEEVGMKVHDRNLEASQQNVKKHLDHALEISCCNPGMDIYENRRQWLAYWIEHDFDGDRIKCGQATGYSRSQISQFLSRTYQDGKSIQERAARSIEAKFGKADRIMETPAPTGDQLPLVPILRHEDESTESIQEEKKLPEYVHRAINALREAHRNAAPREIFDGIAALFESLKKYSSGTITSQEDETVAKAASAASVEESVIAEETKDATDRLATRNEDKRAARRLGGRRSKGTEH